MNKEAVMQELSELYWQLEELSWYSDSNEAFSTVLERVQYLEFFLGKEE